MFYKLRMLLVLALIACVGNAWAVDWTGTITGRTISSNTTVNLTGTVTLTGSIVISGGTTTINASGANRVINRGGRNFAMFDVRSGATLVIKGGTYKVTIDGKNGSYEATASSQWGYSAIIVRDGGTATLTDVTIRNNYLYTYSALTSSSNSHGGAIFVRGTATCNNCTFSNCKADTGGAIAVFNKGNATINGGKIIQCIARHRGGGALAANTVNYCGVSETAPTGSAVLRLYGVTIGGSADDRNNAQNSFGGGAYSEFLRANIIIDQNTVISYNRSNFGGHGVCVADMGNVELKACDIHHNTPYSKTNSYNGDFGGGGLYLGGTVSGGSTATIEEGCLIHHNSGARGAGVYVGAFQNMAEMTVNMQGGKIYSNTTYTGGNYSAGGGGVYMAGTDNKKSYFNMSGGEIYSNTATSNKGGGIYIQVGAVTITGGKIRNNTAQDDGGGIYLNSGNVTMSGGSVYSNNANGTEKNGGGFYLGGGNFTMSGSAEMYSNTAKAGAGIYLNNGTFKMQGGKFYANTATGNGGGAYLTANCTFTMSGGSLGTTGKGKNSAINGGGIYDLGKFTMTGGSIANNEATTGHGGGAFINTTQATALSNGTVIGNTAGQNGGGIYVTGGSAVTVSGVSVYDNEATNLGGGLYITSSAGNSFTMTGGNIGIEGHPNKAKNGGGVYDLRTFTMNGGSISYNEATTNGGGAFINTTEVTKLSSGTIGHNTAANSGGGIYLSNGSVELTSITFDSNTASNQGGGLFAAASVTLKTGSAFYKNQANQGGGIYVNGGTNTATLSMNNGTVGGSAANANIANQHGGGIYVTGTNSTVTLQGGELSYNHAEARGGGLFVNSTSSAGTTLSATAKVNNNSAGTDGGGIFVNSGTLNLTGSSTGLQVNNNTAVASGGGLYAANGNVSITGVGTINNNSARDGGAGYVAGSSATLTLNGTGNGLQVNNNSASYSSTSYGNGGGFYVGGGNVSISGKCTINGNTASDDGGGFYTTGGTVTLNGANCVISNNTAEWWGGGIRAGGSVSISNGHIYNNLGKKRGGGVYVSGGNFTMNGGTIGGTTAQGNTTNTSGEGGGLYMSSGTATITGGSISGNTAPSGNGGGVYMNGGTCILSNGAAIGGTSATYANSAKLGGGVYSNGGTITVRGGKIQRNTADLAGGGIYTNGDSGVVNMEKQTTKADQLSYIEYNTAQQGGGIFASRGVVNFSDGFIQYNFASDAGGGIYVDGSDTDENIYGKLYLRGSANLYRNYVPEGHSGGGVYLKGVVQIGEQVSNPSLLGTIRVQENYAGDSYEYYSPTGDTINNLTANTRNNIYLPDPDTVHSDNLTRPHRGVITLVENGINIEKTRVGFSVPHGFVPVIYSDYSSTSRDYLHQFSTGRANQYAVFDDSRHYIAVQYSNQPEIFDPDHVYLYGFWSNEVTGSEDDEYCYVDPETFDPMNIATPCELAFFISYVNGLNNQTAHPYADGRLVADIDMSAFGWVPIGHLTQGYHGHFDGNGHTVSGILSLLNTEYTDYGFFGNLNGGTVENLFVKDARFSIEVRDDNKQVYIGGIAGHSNGGVIENCEVQSIMYAEDTRTIMGGVIGEMAMGTVHSVCAMPAMTGNTMGGLVGQLVKGTLQNSFANGKFVCENNGYYSGGLVGSCNSGSLVENCYVRLQGVTGTTSRFGVFVGNNSGGAIKFCYAPSGYTNYMATGNDPTGHGNYAVSELPYLYAHRDTQVTLVAGEDNVYVPEGDDVDKQMLVALNRWVDTINSTQSAIEYTSWGRPWQESDVLKFVNDDYPVLKMPVAEAVAAKQNDPYLYYSGIDNLLSLYTGANESMWLYRTPDDTVRGNNASSNAKLYIDENVVLINNNPLKAYVGITLDNSAGSAGANPTYFTDVTDATDWHMVSTSLSNAPMGINYTDAAAYEFDYTHPEGMPYYRFYPKTDAKHGYFPSHRYGTTYSADDSSPVVGGNYYTEWDFYSYYEPEYHWINFKRNSASHRHYDSAEHEEIVYTNEPNVVPGKGYFAATREETFLQCQGNLNSANVTYDLTKSNHVPRHGYNLLGNPFQAYLDFDKFATANAGGTGAIWSDLRRAFYTILDEDNPEIFVGTDGADSLVFYRTYAYGSSTNDGVSPGRYIHPHQGFFVLLEDNATATAKFNLDQRNASKTVNASFRDQENVDYPLVNLFAVEANGNADVVTVELGRPEAGGAPLMSGMRIGNGKIWCHYDDTDYTVAFTEPGLSEANIRFETVEDTEYTMRWNTRNGDFGYLHLIDNITGADVDCLTANEYRFSARKSDYKSRFRLVFEFTGVDENEDGNSSGLANFAFMMGDGLVVTGEGTLQVFDLNGRMLLSRELRDVQTTIQLPQVANGVYMLRLTDGKQSRVQKMVISK